MKHPKPTFAQLEKQMRSARQLRAETVTGAASMFFRSVARWFRSPRRILLWITTSDPRRA